MVLEDQRCQLFWQHHPEGVVPIGQHWGVFGTYLAGLSAATIPDMHGAAHRFFAMMPSAKPRPVRRIIFAPPAFGRARSSGKKGGRRFGKAVILSGRLGRIPIMMTETLS
ncbi:MAG: hypothetical protein J0G94_12975 [Sphingomonadales bacterium]|nr:hypothetical protein [Sphingomonadales bacterium]